MAKTQTSTKKKGNSSFTIEQDVIEPYIIVVEPNTQFVVRKRKDPKSTFIPRPEGYFQSFEQVIRCLTALKVAEKINGEAVTFETYLKTYRECSVELTQNLPIINA